MMGSDDDLAADFVRDAVFAAELDHGCGAGNAEARLKRSGLVVNARVDDAAVVAALVAGHGLFLFEKQKPLSGETASDL